MYCAVLTTGMILMCGMSRFTASISRRTLRAICTVFVPDCFEIAKYIPGVPLMRIMLARRAVASSTLAISFRRIGTPSRAVTIVLRSSSRLAYSPGVLTVTSKFPCSIVPPETFLLAVLIAVMT